ncbi:unnamed protein product, partial [Iphiclides podalirius]
MSPTSTSELVTNITEYRYLNEIDRCTIVALLVSTSLSKTMSTSDVVWETTMCIDVKNRQRPSPLMNQLDWRSRGSCTVEHQDGRLFDSLVGCPRHASRPPAGPPAEAPLCTVRAPWPKKRA